jgi:hypothetical protein
VASTVKLFKEFDTQTTGVLCNRGLKLVNATDSDIRGFRAALQPVFTALQRDAQTRSAIRQIQSMKSGLGAAGAPSVSECGASPTVGMGQSAPINGTYHSTVTRAQLLSDPTADPGEDNTSNYGHFTLTIGDGRFRWSGSLDGIPEGGTAAVSGDRVTLRPTYPADATGQQWVYRWSRYRGVLSFTKLTPGPTFLVVHPWRQ